MQKISIKIFFFLLGGFFALGVLLSGQYLLADWTAPESDPPNGDFSPLVRNEVVALDPEINVLLDKNLIVSGDLYAGTDGTKILWCNGTCPSW